MPTVNRWMSWEGGVDLVACTRPDLQTPNVILHVARLVHTPVGAAPSGIVLYEPDPTSPPALMGFISAEFPVGRYFGPHLFAGTPFEHAPVLAGFIHVQLAADSAAARIVVDHFTFDLRLTGLAAPELIHRPPVAMSPFFQQGLEQPAAKAELLLNGQNVPVIVPPVGITGGPAAVYSACGIYAR